MPQDFYCPTRTEDQCEALALARIPVVNRMEESELYGLCWFDYRHLHPVQRTYLWADYYVKAIQSIFRQTRDADTSAEVHPFRGQDLFRTAEWIGALTARQKLDRLGIRYDFALGYAMTRFSNRGWKVFPRPNQLYGQELIEDANDAWLLECRARLQITENEQFQAKNYRGTPDQAAYRDWLNAQIRTRPMKGWALATPVAQGIYNYDDCERAFGTEAAKQAVKIAAQM